MPKAAKATDHFPVVGVGASAGGLQAFRSFLQGLSATPGMAFILVQHLDPNHKSILRELLQKSTSLPIKEITDFTPIEQDNIYIIPSNKTLWVKDGMLRLDLRVKNNLKKNWLPINTFFESLAKEYTSRAIGIILSGTASDGTKGLKSIKNKGGITFAQDENTAEWPEMPRSAVEAGVVDYILAPQEMGKKIENLGSILSEEKNLKITTATDEKQLYSEILGILKKLMGTDFTHYKPTTIKRRISRRMGINKVNSLKAYLEYLQENPLEQDVLYQALLIPVTEFFRDSEIFDYLCESIFPKLLNAKEKDTPLRIWITACSTGEEAYSLAICLTEFLNIQKNKPPAVIQIFATDLSETAIVKARKGIYTNESLKNVSPKRLKKFFTKVEKGYQIKDSIRELCVFAQHDFLSDPPFVRLDLVTCRNVLIYFEPILQKKALTAFHYALNKDGYLLLGKSESASKMPEHFVSVDKFNKLYKKNQVSPNYQIPLKKWNIKKSQSKITSMNKVIRPEKLQTDIDELILKEYAPAGVVIDDKMEIVHFRGSTATFLEQQTGKPSHNLMKLAKGGLEFELRQRVLQAKKEKKAILKKNIPFQTEKGVSRIAIEVIPLNKEKESQFLILFHIPAGGLEYQEEQKSTNTSEDQKDLRIQALEKELAQAHSDMREISEDQQLVNEELQTANEELISGSEELQTLNEELETSKEELQSTNEEISVVNQELLNLNVELKEERNLAQAVNKALHEPLIILDKNLRVQSANQRFYDKFKVKKEVTEGQLIYNLGNNQWDIPELRTLLENIIPEKKSFNGFQITHKFESIGKRTMLLNAEEIVREDADKSLILLAIEDITKRKKAERKLKKTLFQYNELIHSSPYMFAVLEGPEFKVKVANKAVLKQLNKGDIVGQPYLKAVPELEEQGLGDLLRKVYETGEAFFAHEMPVTLEQDGVPKEEFYSFVYQPQRNAKNEITGVAIIAFQVSSQAQLNKQIRISERRLDEFISSSPSLIGIFRGKDLIVEIANDELLNNWGKTNEVIGKPLLKGVPELKGQGFDELLIEVLETGTPYQAQEVAAEHMHNGKKKKDYYDFIYQPLFDEDGKVVEVAVIATNVTEQARLNRKIRESEQKFRQMADLIPDKITLANTEGETIYVNKSWLEYSGLSFDDFVNGASENLSHPDEEEILVEARKKCFEKGENLEIELRVLDKNEDYRWQLVRGRPIKDENGDITSWITASTEIHKFKEEEERKEAFLKMVSHELKTPVTSIKGYVQLLLSMLKTDGEINWETIPVKPSLQRIDNQITRLTRLISEMLDLTRLEDSQLLLEKQRFNLKELVRDTVQDVKYASDQSNISIIEETDCEVDGDKDRIGQVLINFITNALKYSPDDKNIEVKISSDKKDLISVSVKDHGIGIAKEDQQNVFKRFYRVSGNNEETYSGFGIGLYLAKEIIERHNGIITLESKKGAGSTFTFSLPCV